LEKIGIDSIAVYTSRYALDLAVLAQARGIEAEKFYVGLGQHNMSVPPPGEDIVTMAASAAVRALEGIEINDIEMLLFATESAFDQSKATALYVHQLLGLPPRCRTIELKQACYSGTAAIQLALPYLRENPGKKVLVIASDIARYGLGTTGESSQGCGAVAMVLSANPRIAVIERDSGFVAESVMDFWRPNYLDEALVDGKYSSKLYLTMLEKTWNDYANLSGRSFTDHDYFCYHAAVPRLVEKAHQSLIKRTGQQIAEDVWMRDINYSLAYGRMIGNSYTASLYVGLASLLDLVDENLAGKRIGFYSYGSGLAAEFFSAVIQPQYRAALQTDYHQHMLASRTALTYDEYAAFYQFQYPQDGSALDVPVHDVGRFRLAKMEGHKRQYEKVETPALSVIINEELCEAADADQRIQAQVS
jgi:hydroxymethylglutaryl-CoA synthase